jgi:hypothetical protein
MATPTIPNGEEHFFPIIYEGNGTGQRVGKFVPFTDNGTIANSCIFNRADNPYMSFDKGSITPDSDKKFTFSCWFKLGDLGSNNNTGLFNSNSGGASGGNVTRYAPLAIFHSSNYMFGYDYDSGGYNWYYSMNRTFEDTSKWYHFVIAFDTTQSTSSDRMKIYIDGDQITSFSSITYPALNQDLYNVMAGGYHILGLGYDAKFDGYFAEVNLVENQQLTPSTFGITDTSTGRWIPKTLSGINYGTNGFRLKFQDSSALGDDTSGNTKDFTATNLASTDQTTDSPTQNHNTFGSFASGTSATEGNLTISTGTTNGDTQCVGQAGFGVATGKWYWEAKITTVGAGLYGWKDDANAGGSQAVNTSSNGTHSTNNSAGMLSTAASGSFSAGSWFIDGGYGDEVNYTTVSTNDVLMFAIDLDTGKGYCGKNGTWFNSANPANGTGDIGGCHFANGINKFYPMARRLDANSVAEYNFGQRSFAHTPPTGFSALQQDNLPETAKGISGLVWTKDRDNTYNHGFWDSSRGGSQYLVPNTTGAQGTATDGVQKFLKGGFSVEDTTGVNSAGDSKVAWNFVGNSGTTSSNGDGNVTCTLQVNDTSKFSIQTWTNTGAGTKTIGHGLGVKPGLIIQKRLDTTSNWFTYHHSLTGNGSYLHLNTTDTTQTGSDFANTEPTTSVFSSNASGLSTATFVSYCFAEVDGFSKFGVYEGNNNANGTFVNLGFKPAFVMIKGIDGSSSSYPWAIYDNRRSPTNPVSLFMSANATDVENTLDRIDFLSNGFKLRQAYSYSNAGETYVYVAFAEHPFVGDGTNPVTAR